MTDLKIHFYKDSFAVSCNQRMLIYGLTQIEASLFCKTYNAARGVILAMPEQKQHKPTKFGKKNGRRLILEPYIDLIKAYLATNMCPTIAELDRLLKGQGANYSNITAIDHVLSHLGVKIPRKAMLIQTADPNDYLVYFKQIVSS